MIEVYRVQNGTRTILGTDYPVYNVVHRVDHGGRRWQVTWALCNGTPAGTQKYATKMEAVAAAG